MPVALRLVDVGMAQSRDAIGEHRARVGVDDGQRQAAFVVLRGGDAVAALVHKEPRPVLQPIVVDGVDIAGEKVLDGDLKLNVHGLTNPYACGIAAKGPEPRFR